MIEQALDLDPGNGRYHQALGLLLAAQGLSERANYHLEQARNAGFELRDEPPGQP